MKERREFKTVAMPVSFWYLLYCFYILHAITTKVNLNDLATFSIIKTRDVEAVIFQTLPLPRLSLPLPLAKNEKTKVDNFLKLLWFCSLPSPTLHHFEKTKTFIYCYYFTYFA